MVYVVAGILFAILALFVYMWIQAHLNVVDRNELVLDNLPAGFDGFAIFFITDVHRRIISMKIIEEAKDGSPEMVVIGGDLAEKGVPLHRVEENIKRLSQVGPVYFVWGNNDYEVDDTRLSALLNDKGVTILDNTAVQLKVGGDVVQLLGVDDYGLRRARLDLAVEDASEGFRILLSHNPALAPCIVNNLAHIRLILSGHTHGGQIRIFGWGPRVKGGIKQYQDLTVFTSNGYGTTTLPLRLGARAQTHILILKAR